jgi:hypothetical protein
LDAEKIKIATNFSKLVATVTSTPHISSTHSGSRLDRFHSQRRRAERLNYVAIAIGGLIVLYVLVTIIRPLFASTRPGQVTQDFGCVSKSSVGDCASSVH